MDAQADRMLHCPNALFDKRIHTASQGATLSAFKSDMLQFNTVLSRPTPHVFLYQSLTIDFVLSFHFTFFFSNNTLEKTDPLQV